MDIILLVLVILVFLLFIVGLTIAILPEFWLKIVFGWPNKMYLKMRKFLPVIMFAAEDSIREIIKDRSESKKYAIVLLIVRIYGILLALVACGFLVSFCIVMIK
jgi:hypothetical protein